VKRFFLLTTEGAEGAELEKREVCSKDFSPYKLV